MVEVKRLNNGNFLKLYQLSEGFTPYTSLLKEYHSDGRLISTNYCDNVEKATTLFESAGGWSWSREYAA